MNNAPFSGATGRAADPHAPTTLRSGGAVPGDAAPGRRRRAAQFTEAVIAGYIHAISHAGDRGSRRTRKQLTAQAI